MDQGKRTLTTSLLAAAALAAVATPAHAIVYAESPDAGQTLATAQATAATPGAAGVSLAAINGSIAGTNGLDADLYYITITNTSTFSATASSTASIDTSLFLFTTAGVPVIANDDANGQTIQAGIPAGNSLLSSLSPGTYILGIALSGNEPVNTANQLLFTSDQPTTNVRGIAMGLNPTTLSAFNGGTFFAEGGNYSISLASATTAIPEPSTNAALALGGIAAFFSLRRLRRQRATA